MERGVDLLILAQKYYEQIIFNVNSGNVRETYFANQLSVKHNISSSKKGDFLVDGQYTFEVGGASKGFQQIKDLERCIRLTKIN